MFSNPFLNLLLSSVVELEGRLCWPVPNAQICLNDNTALVGRQLGSFALGNRNPLLDACF